MYRYYASLLLFATLNAVAQAQDPELSFSRFGEEEFSQPIDITNAGDGSDRLFVHQRGGQVVVLDEDGVRLGVFLDISPKVRTSSGEQGLLGLAFSPDYAQSGKFYVNYIREDGSTVISRFRVSAQDPNRADPTEEELLTIAQPQTNHNGGDLAFGPDGLLYAALGDGGGSYDPERNGQNPQTLLGSILRLDVAAERGYTAAGNREGWLPEIFAIGLRNPWRMSFDRRTGNLWIGDVGQSDREEVDVVPAGAEGTNLGWLCYEGTLATDRVAGGGGCGSLEAYTVPVWEYGRNFGRSITGGVVYRGTEHPELTGYYLGADFAAGATFALRLSEDGASIVDTFTYEGGDKAFAGFGEDEAGEVYGIAYGAQDESVAIYKAISLLTPLPVELTAFTAGEVTGGIEVRWTTGSEVDASHFEIWSGASPASFSKVAEVPAGGAGDYRITIDRQLAETQYIQLRAVDLDGSPKESRVVTVENNRGGTEISVRVDGEQISLINEKSSLIPGDLVAVDASGRTIYQSSDANLPISTSDWPSGTYYIKVNRYTIEWVKI